MMGRKTDIFTTSALFKQDHVTELLSSIATYLYIHKRSFNNH